MARLSIVIVLVLGVASCTSGPESPPRSSANEPKDRNADAVTAALRQLDFCAIVGSVAGEYSPVATAPQTCEGRENPDVHTPDFTMKVAPFGEEFRKRHLPATDLGGAKAYVEEAQDDHCNVYLPVSFELTISFEAIGVSCSGTKGIVAAAARMLADPKKVRFEPRWDACGLLAAAGEKGRVDGFLEQCTTSRSTQLRLRYQPIERLTESGDYQKEVLDGTEAWVWDYAGCEVSWNAGKPPTSRVEAGAVFLVSVERNTCAEARELARRVMSVVHTAPPTDVTPQQPILYRPNEPDLPK